MSERIGLASLTIMNADVLGFLEAAGAGTFAFVTLRLIPSRPGDTYIPLVGNRKLLSEVRQRLDTLGLGVYDIESISLDPRTIVGSFEAAIALGAELGASKLLVHATDTDRSRLVYTLAELCDLAATYRMGVGFECMPFRAVKTIAEVDAIISATRKPNLGVIVDAMQLSRAGGTPSALATIDPARIAYAQICDGRAEIPATLDDIRREAREDRLLPGQGVLPLYELLDALPGDVTLTLEAPCAEFRDLPPAEQGRRAGEATHAFMRQYRDRRKGFISSRY